MAKLNFQKYEDYHSEEFATDIYFSQWVQTPDNLTVSYFWESFLKKYPEKEYEIDMARHKISNPIYQFEHFSQCDIDSLWNQINTTITTN